MRDTETFEGDCCCELDVAVPVDWFEFEEVLAAGEEECGREVNALVIAEKDASG